ncbi:hypothetical protein DW750_15300 [Bacteroides sp. AM28-6]|nr:hypothetical protein [Parabacteroides sp.]RJU69410.1 hypothetical protein DW750_15300 [Bacteroides sp. AM28-6]RJV57327.1 hypothetical protein DWW63_15690 [Bacteroides sp. AF16-29]RJX04210.1 hypothetical protein DWW34_16585 [Bacteroides sp. AF15-23LB]
MYDHQAGQPKVGRNRPISSRIIRAAYARWSVPTLGYWAKYPSGSMALHGLTSNTAYLLLSARWFQYATGTTPNCAIQTPQAATKLQTVSRYGGIE